MTFRDFDGAQQATRAEKGKSPSHAQLRSGVHMCRCVLVIGGGSGSWRSVSVLALVGLWVG